MDKNQLQQTLSGATINVQGDFVMEKHVEHEVGNVENGGIGIQIVQGNGNKAERTKSENKDTTPHPDSVPELNSPEAQALWLKAQEAGWVDEKRQPTRMLPTKTAKAVFANVFADMLRMDNPIYPPFEEIWNIRDLQNSYSSGMQFEKNKTLKDEIQKTLR